MNTGAQSQHFEAADVQCQHEIAESNGLQPQVNAVVNEQLQPVRLVALGPGQDPYPERSASGSRATTHSTTVAESNHHIRYCSGRLKVATTTPEEATPRNIRGTPCNLRSRATVVYLEVVPNHNTPGNLTEALGIG